MKTQNGAATTAVEIPSIGQLWDQRRKIDEIREIFVQAKECYEASKQDFVEWKEINNGDQDALWWIYAFKVAFDLALFRRVQHAYCELFLHHREMIKLRTAYVTGQIDGVLAVDEKEDDDDDWDDEDF